MMTWWWHESDVEMMWWWHNSDVVVTWFWHDKDVVMTWWCYDDDVASDVIDSMEAKVVDDMELMSACIPLGKKLISVQKHVKTIHMSSRINDWNDFKILGVWWLGMRNQEQE